MEYNYYVYAKTECNFLINRMPVWFREVEYNGDDLEYDEPELDDYLPPPSDYIGDEEHATGYKQDPHPGENWTVEQWTEWLNTEQGGLRLSPFSPTYHLGKEDFDEIEEALKLFPRLL